MISICKRYTFEASHDLPNHKGHCKDYHGHGYKLEVEVARPDTSVAPSPAWNTNVEASDWGMVVDFSDLDQIVKPLVKLLDHTYLNESAADHLNVPRTTAEFLVSGIVAYIRPAIKHLGLSLIRLRLWETEKAYAEWKL